MRLSKLRAEYQVRSR